MSEKVLPITQRWRSPKGFVILALTFSSLIRFDFIFVYGVKESNFNLSHIQCKSYSFHHQTALVPLLKINCHNWKDWFLDSQLCCIDLCVCFCASTTLSWWPQLCSTTWNLALWCPQIWFSFLKFPWLFGVFKFLSSLLRIFIMIWWYILSYVYLCFPCELYWFSLLRQICTPAINPFCCNVLCILYISGFDLLKFC